MFVNPFREPSMRRLQGLIACYVASHLLGRESRNPQPLWFWLTWVAFGLFLGILLLFYQPAPVKPKSTFRHPAWSKVPPGHCPICKANLNEDCDAGLHS